MDDLQLSLKAEGLSTNFCKVATSSTVSPQIYTYPQSLMSGGLIQYSCHYDASHRNIGWPTKSNSV